MATTTLLADGEITLRLPGSENAATIGGFQVAVPVVIAVNGSAEATGVVDQDGLKANLADALEAAAAELRKGSQPDESETA